MPCDTDTVMNEFRKNYDTSGGDQQVPVVGLVVPGAGGPQPLTSMGGTATGETTDAASTATDTTAATGISIWKQISKILQDVWDSTLHAIGVKWVNALQYNIDSITTYHAGCELTTVDLATDADVVVTASPAYLLGIYVLEAMSAHVANIQDSATVKIPIPASTAAGTTIPGYSGTFATNITVNSDNAATGKLLVFWRAA